MLVSSVSPTWPDLGWPVGPSASLALTTSEQDNTSDSRDLAGKGPSQGAVHEPLCSAVTAHLMSLGKGTPVPSQKHESPFPSVPTVRSPQGRQPRLWL